MHYKHSSQWWEKQRARRRAEGCSASRQTEASEQTTWPLSVLVGSQKMTDRRAAANNKLSASPWQKRRKTKEGKRLPKWMSAHATCNKTRQTPALDIQFFILISPEDKWGTHYSGRGRRLYWPRPLTPFACAVQKEKIVLLLHLLSRACARLTWFIEAERDFLAVLTLICPCLRPLP